MLQQIKASAGSGKTYSLTRQFLTLLKQAVEEASTPACALFRPQAYAQKTDFQDMPQTGEHSWPEILAVTFTNKAATEMRERIVRSLKERALGIEPHNAASDWDEPTAARWVDILLRRYSSLNVRTIDSLLNMLVRLSALELGLPPDFEPVFDEKDLFEPLYDRMLDAARAGGPERDLLADACRSLLMLTDKEGFVPGESIRTRLYELMSKRLADGALPDADGDALRGWLVNMHTEYLNAVQAVIWLMQAESLAPQANFTKFLDYCLASGPFKAPKASAYAAKPHIDDCLLKASRGKATDDLDAAYKDLRDCHTALEGPGHLIRKALTLVPFVRLAEPLSQMVHELEQIEGKVPATLWPRYAQQILSGEAGASEAFCRMGTRLTHLLIDEFQDTSIPQWQAIQPLALECLSKGGSLTYVGDVKQAIYSWRGGDSALFESILNDPELRAIAPAPKRVPLPNNWRSCKEIVDFNNSVFCRLAEPEIARAFAEALLSGASEPIIEQTVQEIVQGFSGASQDVPNHKQGSGGYVHLYDISGEKKEHLIELAEDRFITLFRDELIPRRRPGDIAVLVRTNDEASLVAGWLVDLNIPVITENSLKLADHPVINQTVSFLRFLDYPMDDLAFWECIAGRGLFADMAGISATELDDWLTRPRTGKLFSAFREAYPAQWRTWLAPFYSQAGLMSTYDTVRELFCRFRAFERFPQDSIFLRRFLEVVFAAEDHGKRSLSAFLDYWTESGGEEMVPMPENVDAVRVMTMHKSKGLEFPVTVIPFHHHTLRRSDEPERIFVNGQDMIVPRCKELGEPYYRALAAEAREQLHLLYVAWTRPVEELHAFITTSPHHETKSPTLVALRLLLEQYGMGHNRENPEAEVILGKPPVSLLRPASPMPATCAGSTHLPDETGHRDGTTPPPSPDTDDKWKPMQWLPRLKIFRNPLKELVFDERRRGTLVHGCLERLHLTDANSHEALKADVLRAIRHGMRAYPLPVPDRPRLENELQIMFEWLASQPLFAHWQQYGTPEQSIMDSHGAQHRTDLFVDDGTTLTVVEYKTGQPSAAHRRQVSRYINLLAAIPFYAEHSLQSCLVYLDRQEMSMTEHPRSSLPDDMETDPGNDTNIAEGNKEIGNDR